MTEMSTSNNACVVKFIGGPWDGMSKLQDHDKYCSINVLKDGVLFMYARKSKNLYKLKRKLKQ